MRLVGFYSHQALAVALFLGVCWVVPSRAWLAYTGELDTRFLLRLREADARPELVQAVGRGLFWAVLTAAILVIWPRSPELTPMLWGIGAMGALRLLAELFPTKRPNHATTAVMALAALVMTTDLVRVVLPGKPAVVVMRPPFEGTWQVLQGGASPLVSHHLSAYNQVYALDLVALDDEGRIFVEGADPSDPNGLWVSWNQPYVSPVAGTVVAARGDVPDAAGINLETELDAAVGNHVILETADGYFVVLAHLQQGSLQVDVGDTVAPGDPLGRCGNSGNTTSPHLHLQVQTHADLWHEDNRSVPFAFEPAGRALRRNARITGTQQERER